jgi:Conserved TM helix
MKDALRDGLSTIAEFVPKLVLFLVILIVGIIIAKVIAKALNAILERVGFDRAVERGGIRRALSSSKMDASDIVAKLIYYTLLLFVLQLAFGVFGPNPISSLIEDVIRFIPSLIVAIIILVVAASIAAAVKGLIENMLGGLSYGRTLANIASIFILFLGVVAALNQVGVATTVTTPVLIAILATVAGVIIVGVGGGLIRPMQQRWESYLTTAEREAPRMKEQARNAPSVRDQAASAAQDLRPGSSSAESSGSATVRTPVYDQDSDLGTPGAGTGYGDPAPRQY